MKNNIYELIIQSDNNIIATYNGQSAKGAIDHRDIELLNVIGKGNFKDKNDIDIIGERLYETIFKDEIDYHFTDKVLSRLDDHDDIVQIKIIFQEGINASYYNLPWEYLKNNKKQLFIGTHPKLSLTFDHYINKKTRKKVQVEAPIRVMLVCFDIPGETATAILPVLNFLKDHSLNKNITITQLQNPSFDEIVKSNNSFKPHIFHFLGHGKYIKTGNDSFYCLINNLGKGYWENSDTFSECFNIWKPYLLFIQSCESARSSTSINFFGGAAQYVRNNIPSVLLFRYPLLQETGWVFSKEFYRELLKKWTN
ncbi:hypothetical protein ES705_48120 [subsurface metagenome]